jgi:hypothetical protein
MLVLCKHIPDPPPAVSDLKGSNNALIQRLEPTCGILWWPADLGVDQTGALRHSLELSNCGFVCTEIIHKEDNPAAGYLRIGPYSYIQVALYVGHLTAGPLRSVYPGAGRCGLPALRVNCWLIPGRFSWSNVYALALMLSLRSCSPSPTRSSRHGFRARRPPTSLSPGLHSLESYSSSLVTSTIRVPKTSIVFHRRNCSWRCQQFSSIALSLTMNRIACLRIL